MVDKSQLVVECQIVDPESSDALKIDIEMGSLIDKNCQSMGLIVRPLWNMCVFSPPLVINKNQIDDMFNILEKGIIKTTEDLSKKGIFKG